MTLSLRRLPCNVNLAIQIPADFFILCRLHGGYEGLCVEFTEMAMCFLKSVVLG